MTGPVQTAVLLRVVLDGLVQEERWLPESVARYTARVHRLRPGDRFLAVDPMSALEADAEVLEIEGRKVRVGLGPVRTASGAAALPITLLQALGKGNKPDQVVRDATALGVRRIVFVETRRTTVTVGERAPARRERWARIALQAARQCGRPDVPEIAGPVMLPAALTGTVGASRWCLVPTARLSLRAALAAAEPSAGIAVLIGPEGGFESSELALAARAGFTEVRVAPYVLRTETVATAAIGAIVCWMM